LLSYKFFLFIERKKKQFVKISYRNPKEMLLGYSEFQPLSYSWKKGKHSSTCWENVRKISKKILMDLTLKSFTRMSILQILRY
jgi:hypothetical protein